MTTRGLVLSGGGPLAVAWESGLVAGFAQAGVDLRRADYVLGTSAGAQVGARIAAEHELAGLADPILMESGPPLGPRPSPEALAKLPELFRKAQDGLGNPAEARAEIGAYALTAETVDEATFLASFAWRVPQGPFPEKPFACTAVDAEDGGFQLITANETDDLIRAVAASSSLPGISPPVTVGGRRYMDGGLRSTFNADLAAGFDVVLVVAFVPPGPAGVRMQAKLDQEIDSLQEGGSTVVTVTPDEGVLAAIGPNTSDFSRRPAVARAGIEQGLAQAPVLKEVWG